jgi:HAE1 family hydrophobic/amphiphilic exporter-1
VAEVALGTAQSGTISRTNGKSSLVLAVVKDPDANTVAVTDGVLALLGKDTGLPPGVEIAILSNDGPEVTKELGSVQHDALIGLVLAIIVVFAFLLNLRPGLLRGAALTLRPTLIIGLTIPLSIFAGVLLLGPAGISLNFMSLAGLAVSIGNVVDNSIVVLENIYRHINKNGDRLEAVFQGTAEVGAAIFASTMANIVVFLPLAFIQGLVGSFFTPFALTISFVLLASVLVPLTAVPALSAVFLRPGDFPDTDDPYTSVERETLLQRWFVPVLRWCLGHKIPTLAIALASTIGSLALVLVIPVTLFPSGVPQYLTIDLELPTGTGVGRTFDEVLKIEQALQGFRDQGMVDVYHVTLGSASNQFGPGAAGGGSHLASIFVLLAKDVPRDIADQLRAEMPTTPGATVTVAELSNGPPTDNLELRVVGSNFTAVAATARELVAGLKEVDGVINLSSDVSDARDEVVVNVDPGPAAEFGLTASLVGQQVGQFVVGRKVAEIDLEGRTLDLVVRGRPDTVDDIGQLQDLTIQGSLGRVKLGSISHIAVEKGPVSVSHFDGERSASITGNITAVDTQAVGVAVQAKIDALALPPGVEVVTGGIFQQITEGFQDVFLAIGAGIVLIYLVMLITLGSLRMPLIILTSLPLALVGALGALAITGRSLSLSALMGFLLLVGIVVNNAIVLLTFVEQLEKEGLDVYEALLEAGRVRLRPILMTASVTLIALMPLALGSADEGVLIGAELATVIIGGLLSSTLLTLVVVPALYAGINVDLPRLFRGIGATLGRLLSGRRAYPLPGPASGDGD